MWLFTPVKSRNESFENFKEAFENLKESYDFKRRLSNGNRLSRFYLVNNSWNVLRFLIEAMCVRCGVEINWKCSTLDLSVRLWRSWAQTRLQLYIRSVSITCTNAKGISTGKVSYSDDQIWWCQCEFYYWMKWMIHPESWNEHLSYVYRYFSDQVVV